jgi:hypothetical protein
MDCFKRKKRSHIFNRYDIAQGLFKRSPFRDLYESFKKAIIDMASAEIVP